MPILKVSDHVFKYALETIRVPLSIIGDCPQCQSNGYRDGICPDCGFVHPNVQAAIQEWQNAMGIQQVVQQQQQSLAEQNPNAKAAYRSLAFVDMFPSINSKKTKCTRCKQMTFVDGKCENAECAHETPPEGLGFKRPKFLGRDPKWLKKVNRGLNILSPGEPQIVVTEAREKINKTKESMKLLAAAQKQPQLQMDPGALQDNSYVVNNDPTTRMKNMLQQSAQIDAQGNQNNENANNSEEPQ